jgi:hypothetical protein
MLLHGENGYEIIVGDEGGKFFPCCTKMISGIIILK